MITQRSNCDAWNDFELNDFISGIFLVPNYEYGTTFADKTVIFMPTWTNLDSLDKNNSNQIYIWYFLNNESLFILY